MKEKRDDDLEAQMLLLLEVGELRADAALMLADELPLEWGEPQPGDLATAVVRYACLRLVIRSLAAEVRRLRGEARAKSH